MLTRNAAGDLGAVVKDMLRRPRHRELGPALHRQNAREAHDKLTHVIDLLIRTTRGNPPPPDGESGPTLH